MRRPMTPLLAVLPLLVQARTESAGFDALLLRHAGSWSGAALVARAGEPLLLKGYGFADFESNRSNDADTLFDVGPLTQAFTVLAIERLARAGALALDDRIAVRLAGVPSHSADITLRQLLEHTSGIPGGNTRGHGDDPVLAVALWLDRGPQTEPGARREFWPGGYALLAAVLERIGGQPYPELVRADLLEPLGMTASGFRGEAALGPLSALGHTAAGEARPAWATTSPGYGYEERGIVGLVTSARDLLMLERALRGPTDDAPDSTRPLGPAPGPGALAWRTGRAVDGSPRLEGGGPAPGFASVFRHLPEHDACVAVLANREDAAVEQIADDLESLLLGRRTRSFSPREGLGAEEAAACAGTYVSALGRLEVRAAPGVLMAGIEGRELLERAGAFEPLGWKADLPLLERRAFEIVDGLARGDTQPLRTHVAARVARSWPETMRRQIWPAHLQVHGAYRGARPLGVLVHDERVQVLLALEHERGPARAVATFGPAGLEGLDWQGPWFPASARLERVRKGSFRLLLGADPARLEFELAGERATSVRLAGQVLERARD